MSLDLSNDLDLPRKKILRGKTHFQSIFKKSRRIPGGVLDLRYQIREPEPHEMGTYRFGFIVKKKLGNAVKRNLCKRRMREAFRHHQHLIFDQFSQPGISIHGVLITKSISAGYETMADDCQQLLTAMNTRLLKHRTKNA